MPDNQALFIKVEKQTGNFMGKQTGAGANNFQGKKLSKSIVLYHQMKNN